MSYFLLRVYLEADKTVNECKVLFVDNDPMAKRIYEQLAKGLIKEHAIVSSGKEALKIFIKEKPEVVVLDANPLEINGIELAKKIKKIDQSTSVLFVSKTDDTEILKSLIAIGVDSYLEKPLFPKDLYEAICACAKKSLASRHTDIFSQNLQEIYGSANLIFIITNGVDIFGCNNNFLEFFGVTALGEFKEKYKTLLSAFVQRDGYIFPQNNNWLSQISSAKEADRKIALKGAGEEHKVFFPTFNKIKDQEFYVVTFTDITEFDKKHPKEQKETQQSQNTKIQKQWIDILKDVGKEIYRAKRYDTSFGLLLINCLEKGSGTPNRQKNYELVEKQIYKIIRPTDGLEVLKNYQFLVIATHTKMEGCNMFAKRLLNELTKSELLTSYNLNFAISVAVFRKNDSLNIIIKRLESSNLAAVKSGGNGIAYAEAE